MGPVNLTLTRLAIKSLISEEGTLVGGVGGLKPAIVETIEPTAVGMAWLSSFQMFHLGWTYWDGMHWNNLRPYFLTDPQPSTVLFT